MKQEAKKKLYIFLPWILTLVLVGAVLLFSEGKNPFETAIEKGDLASMMRIHLLEAIEAEKNAVLAATDETSEQFADRARQAAGELENNRQVIESLIRQDNVTEEAKMLDDFNICWTQFKNLNETILNLATQNTNLKAQKISTIQGSQEMVHFEHSLRHIIGQNAGNSQCNNAVVLSYEALTAGLKILTLHKPHIEEADDQKMDDIEQSIKLYDSSARKALDSLHSMAGQCRIEELKNAETVYEQFMASTNEVLRLSRMNTNVKSAELSLGRKRLVSSQCLEVLTKLQDAVQIPWTKATR